MLEFRQARVKPHLKRRNSVKRILVFLLAALMISSVYAGGSNETDVPEGMIALPTSGQKVVQTAVPLIAGERLGTWEDYGLYVTRTHYANGPSQLEAAPTGDWEIGWIGATAALTGILSYDMNVIGISGYDNSDVAFCRAGSNLADQPEGPIPGTLGTADDWRGKQILVPVGTVEYCDLMLTLDGLGLTSDDVTIINSSGANAYQAFLAGNGDIFFTSGSNAAKLMNNDDFVCCHTMSGMNAAMAGTIIADKEWLQENEDAAVSYLAGALEILMWLKDEANAVQSAEWFSEILLDEFGVEVAEEEALDSFNMIGFRDFSYYESLCKVQENGLTGMQNELNKFFDYHVQMGSIEEADRDAVLNAVDISYLEKAIELYKSRNSQ